MRTLGLFNMVYGTTGLVSSLSIDRPDGLVISLWVLALGALGFLGFAPSRRAIVNMLRGASQ